MSTQFQSPHAECLGALPTVSVVVNNYNYAAYVESAIQSTLQQDYERTEVVVVDDGSTDCSLDVIAEFESRIRMVAKPNGGQASALNTGFAESCGDIIIFLDSDDVLMPTAASNAVASFREPGISNVRWSMWLIDSEGKKTGGIKPVNPPPEGDFREQLMMRGPTNVPGSPTSGNAWSRSFLKRVHPIPENVAYYRKCADEYLYTLAPAFGRLGTISEPQSCYRIHDESIYSSRSSLERIKLELAGYDDHCRAVNAALSRNGIAVDINNWKRHSWFHQLKRTIDDILHVVPENADLVLVEGNSWDAAAAFGSRNVRPFLTQDGCDWGPPANSTEAIAALESIRRSSIDYLAFGWPSFWWLDEYRKFFEHLEQAATCLLRNDVVVIYSLRPTKAWR